MAEVAPGGGQRWGKVVAEEERRWGEVAAALPFQCSLETRGAVEGCWKGPPAKEKTMVSDVKHLGYK